MNWGWITVLLKKLYSTSIERRGPSGFTVVELLVVMAVAALLSAMLYPVFNSAREKAKQSACISNIKSISSAIKMYALDHNQKIPDRVEGDNSWAGTLKKSRYIESYAMFKCPNDTRDMLLPDPSFMGSKDHWDKISYNYAPSGSRRNSSGVLLSADPTQFENQDNPNGKIALSSYDDVAVSGIHPPLPFCGNYGPDITKSAGGEHGNAYFVLYRDGHGEKYSNNTSGAPTAAAGW
jgi:prepilin-type N-terminal cleavage/methylation domain-containing protein